MAAVDFNKLTLLAHQMITTHYRHGWQFRIEVTTPSGEISTPDDFDIYVKDITYDPVGIDIETEKIGGHTFVWPTGSQTITLSMTVRDNTDLRIRKWFEKLVAAMFETDIYQDGQKTGERKNLGTVNLLKDIRVLVTKYALNHDGSDGDSETWEMIPTKLGEITEARDSSGDIEFPITFVQITTLAKVPYTA